MSKATRIADRQIARQVSQAAARTEGFYRVRNEYTAERFGDFEVAFWNATSQKWTVLGWAGDVAADDFTVLGVI